MGQEAEKPRFDPEATAAGRVRRPSGANHAPADLTCVPTDLRDEFRPLSMREARTIELRLASDRLRAAHAFDHKNEGTFQTHAHAARTNQGALARLFVAGHLSRDEWAWAGEIAMTAEMIERDVAVRVVSYEPRIDCSASGRNYVAEGVMTVRRQVAYSFWRRWIPEPKRMVLDMIVGEPKAFSTIAREYGVHKRRTRALLISCIQMWPDAMEAAEVEIEAAQAGLI